MTPINIGLQVIRLVAAFFGLEPESVLARGREPQLVMARNVSIHILKTKARFSHFEMTEVFEMDSYSTSIYAMNWVKERRSEDPGLDAGISLLELTVEACLRDGRGAWLAGREVISQEVIIQAVAIFYDVKLEEVLRKSRNRRRTLARQVAMALSRELLGSSYPKLGRAFGCDHSTVISAVQRVQQLREDDATFAKSYQFLLDSMKSQHGGE